MATASVELLVDGFNRVQESVHDVLEGLGEEQLTARLDQDANPIGWLVWHLTRVQDDHIAEVAGREQAWTEAGYHQDFGLPYHTADHGYGHSTAQVGSFGGVTAKQLADYHDAVHARTVEYLRTLSDADYQRIVDDSWDPPVTLAVRLVSVLAEDHQHVGQAAYVRGILERR
ncbi:mycothiol transferase [Phaeacidiphilus oryzae]|jgi:uncharacterized damage-inducible protein DinB|uniref:mycothiol transferase n=1 Tax=Phaeacidiphilus oryzae TaxID=348818 RepID=UPI0005622A69|nr:DinB family protein [Phaeacidiphilus oryzae]